MAHCSSTSVLPNGTIVEEPECDKYWQYLSETTVGNMLSHCMQAPKSNMAACVRSLWWRQNVDLVFKGPRLLYRLWLVSHQLSPH